MQIDFNALRKQSVDKDIIIDILENIYNLLKNTTDVNIIFNEICKVNKTVTNEFKITLSKKPISTTDILIVANDGSVVITPSNIIKMDGNDIFITSKNIKQIDYVYATYKY